MSEAGLGGNGYLGAENDTSSHDSRGGADAERGTGGSRLFDGQRASCEVPRIPAAGSSGSDNEQQQCRCCCIVLSGARLGTSGWPRKSWGINMLSE